MLICILNGSLCIFCEVIMNYKNIFSYLFLVLFLGCVQLAPAMEMKVQQISPERALQIRNNLIIACEKGNFGLVKHLIEKDGANVNVENVYKSPLDFAFYKLTPLDLACSNGHVEIAKYLIEKGAHVNSDGMHNWTPLHSACELGFYEIAKCLVEHGANIHAKDSDGIIPIQATCVGVEKSTGLGKAPNHSIIKLLLEKGASIEAVDCKKNTVLHAACQNGFYDTVQYLVEEGADIHAKNEYGSTPLLFAAFCGHLDIVKLLIQNKADINVKTFQSYTILHGAAYNGQTAVVQYLLKEAPALINAQMEHGFTALDVAYNKKHEAVVKSFKQHGIRIVSEEEAEKNMRAFFVELDTEAQQAQERREQRKQKKSPKNKHNGQNKQAANQNVKNKTNNNNNSINITQNVKSVGNDVIQSIAPDKLTETNIVQCIASDKPAEVATDVTSSAEQAVTMFDATSIDNSSDNSSNESTSGGSRSPVSCCINNSSASKSKKAIEIITKEIATKKQESGIQTSSNKPAHISQPIQNNNQYQIGYNAKLKWPRSLSGTHYNNMRDHLTQLKQWPEVPGLDIKVLKGQSGRYRLRVGGYRVLFTIDKELRRIVIDEIGLRKKVYRGLGI